MKRLCRHLASNFLNLSSGVRGVQVEEVYSLDKEQLKSLKPVHGLIFLFKWVADDSPPAGSVVLDSRADAMFFAKQVEFLKSVFFAELSLPLASTGWVWPTILSFFALSTLILCRTLCSIDSVTSKFGNAVIRPGPAVWGAQMLPLCYANPQVSTKFHQKIEDSYMKLDWGRRELKITLFSVYAQARLKAFCSGLNKACSCCE